MGSATARSRRRRAPGGGLALLVAAAALAGCGLVTGLVHTQSGLEHAGYGNATVTFSTTGARTTVRVTADRSATAGAGLAAQARGAATVVWRTLPGSFQRLAVTVRGAGTVQYDDARLRQLFGPRPASLDQQSLAGTAAHDGALAVAGLLLLLAVLALVVVVVAMSLRRRRRRDRAARTALLMSTIPEHLWAHADPSLAGGAGRGPVQPMPPPGVAPPMPPPGVAPQAPPPGVAPPPPPVPTMPPPPVPPMPPMPPPGVASPMPPAGVAPPPPPPPGADGRSTQP